ncbi:hypothetical protein MKX01_033290 [Papaver californicum]|nr:hypothetical protein MKX01_033290 [Papaver californicum]
MDAKTDSEVTSLPALSPERPVYYVQSSSRDSHDGEKTTTSFHSTPVLSPMGSPPHSHSSVRHHSRESSSCGQKPGNNKGDCDVIEEEGLHDEEDTHKSLPRPCYVLAFVVGFFILFSFFSLILYFASLPQKPVITMKSINFEQLLIQAGSDPTGVPTPMVSMNSSVKLLFRNTATFFGVHVTSTPLLLSYSDGYLASGSMKKFYQSKKSQRTLTVVVKGNKIPLYATGFTLAMNLNFKIRSRFYKSVNCSIVFDPKILNVAIPLKNCTYTS